MIFLPLDGSEECDPSPSIETLVRRAQRNPGSRSSRDAAAGLLERYQDEVYALCRRYADDRDTALDLAQDVLLIAYEKLSTLEDPSRFGSWLFTITRNRCLNAVIRRRETVELDTEQLLDRRDTAAADRIVLARDDEERLLAMISAVLDEVEQDVVWMKYVDGFSIKEIDRMLEIDTRSGARAVLQRARRKLRNAYDSGDRPPKEFFS